MSTATPTPPSLYAPVGTPHIKELRELWGVGRADLPGGTVPYYLSHHDIQADTAWMEQLLDRMGLTKGKVAFVPFTIDQMGQLWPVDLACIAHGLPLGAGINSRFDAYRMEMFLRRLPTDMVFGVSQELLTGLKDGGHDIAQVLSRARNLVAYPDAWADLKALGLSFWKLLPIGPILSFEPPEGGGFLYDETEWQLEADEQGELLLTSSPHRACGFERVTTGVKAALKKADGASRICPRG